MEEARKLVMRSPLPESSRGPSPIEMPVTPGHTLLNLIKDISTEVGEPVDLSLSPLPKSPFKPGEDLMAGGLSGLLSAAGAHSRTVSPKPCSPGPGQPTPKGSPMPTPGGPSPARSPRPISPVAEEPTQSEPSPLKAKRVPGDTPPKVIKRKPGSAPGSSDEQSAETAEDGKSIEDIAVARPVAPEVKPVDGALPPPPAVVKPKAPLAPTMEVTPSTPPVHAPSSPSQGPSRPVSPAKPPSPPRVSRPASPARPPSPPQKAAGSAPASRPSTPTARISSPVPAATLPRTPSPPQRLASTSSTEQLIPPPSPEPLHPTKKLEEVKTIRRQPKTGWL